MRDVMKLLVPTAAVIIIACATSASAQTARDPVKEADDRLTRIINEAASSPNFAGLVSKGRIATALPAGRADLFAVDLISQYQYVFLAACDDACPNVDLVLRKPDGSELAADRDEDPTPIVSHTAGISGKYALEVYVAACQTEPCGVAVIRYSRPVNPGPVASARESNWERCVGENSDAGIDGCTAIIQSGREAEIDLAAALDYRGGRYLQKGEFAEAIQDYTEAIKRDSYNVGLLVQRGLSYDGGGDHDRAIQDYDEVLRRYPDHVPALGNRSIAYLGKSDFDSAIRDANRIITLEPAEPMGFANRALASYRKGDYDRAIEDFTHVIKQDPGAFTLTQLRGLAYFKKGAFPSAIADFDAALKVAPDLAGILYARGVAKVRIGDASGGNADIAAATKLDAKIAESMAEEGIALTGSAPPPPSAPEATAVPEPPEASSSRIRLISVGVAGLAVGLIIAFGIARFRRSSSS